MVKYDFDIDTERCILPLTGNPGKYVEVTLARVSYCGKLGLTHYEDEFPDEDSDEFSFEEVVIPFVYDDLVMKYVVDGGYVITKKYGYKGLQALKAVEVDGQIEVYAKPLLTCEYDQIVGCLGAFLLYRGEHVMYYDIEKDMISEHYDGIQELYANILGCWLGNRQIIVNLNCDVELYQPERHWKYDFLCRYDNGCIFKVTKNGRTIDDLSARLVFYSDYYQKVCYTKIYDQISVLALDDGCGCLKATEIHLISNDKMEKISATKIFVSDLDIDKCLKAESEEDHGF